MREAASRQRDHRRPLRRTPPRQFHIIYVSVHAIAPGRRSRRREAIGEVRHVFLEADHDGPGVLARMAARADLPAPSYVLHSSPNRVHIFWRVRGLGRHDPGGPGAAGDPRRPAVGSGVAWAGGRRWGGHEGPGLALGRLERSAFK
jgi:hypothetical protein